MHCLNFEGHGALRSRVLRRPLGCDAGSCRAWLVGSCAPTKLCANQAVHQPSWGVTTRNGRKSPILGGQKRHPPKRQSFLSVVICRGNGTRHSIVHNMWSTWTCQQSLWFSILLGLNSTNMLYSKDRANPLVETNLRAHTHQWCEYVINTTNCY